MPPTEDTNRDTHAVGADEESRACKLTGYFEALHNFATFAGKTQSAAHIKPLHWYVACRLVLEGGFRPEDVTPQPPFQSSQRGRRWLLHFDPMAATNSEATVLGGLKTKNVDVTVTKQGIGPVIAISCKGVTGAYRNLTNRMEDTIGEVTNLHLTYPALVAGYLTVLRANRSEAQAVAQVSSEHAPAAKQLKANDMAVREGGEPVEIILRFHKALREITGRQGIRNDVSRYEAVGLQLVDMSAANIGQPLSGFPPDDSPVSVPQFFKTIPAA